VFNRSLIQRQSIARAPSLYFSKYLKQVLVHPLRRFPLLSAAMSKKEFEKAYHSFFGREVIFGPKSDEPVIPYIHDKKLQAMKPNSPFIPFQIGPITFAGCLDTGLGFPIIITAIKATSDPTFVHNPEHFRHASN
jgi:hypothetical protein